MLARDGAAVAHDKIGSLFHKLTELGDALFRLQVKVDTGVYAAVAEVAVERAFVGVGGHHLAEVAKISAKFFGSDRGIFPALPIQRFAGRMGSYTERRFPDFPYAFNLLLVSTEPHVGRMSIAGEGAHQAAGLGFGVRRGFRAELDH